jgi:hypothetical protein
VKIVLALTIRRFDFHKVKELHQIFRATVNVPSLLSLTAAAEKALRWRTDESDIRGTFEWNYMG